MDFQENMKGANGPMRYPVDRVISCVGWNGYVASVWGHGVNPSFDKMGKFPLADVRHESVDVPDLYVAGALIHGRDYGKTPGGFVHGYRYLARWMFRNMEEKYYGVPIASKEDTTYYDHTIKSVLRAIQSRLKNASSWYQMYGVLCDVIVLGTTEVKDPTFFHVKQKGEVMYVRDVLAEGIDSSSLFDNYRVGSSEGVSYITLTLGYGRDFSGAAVMGANRAVVVPDKSYLSNFLHPIMRRYVWKNGVSTPVQEFHMHEEFNAEWDTRTHIAFLGGWLQTFLNQDTQNVVQTRSAPGLYDYRDPSPTYMDDSTALSFVSTNYAMASAWIPENRFAICRNYNITNAELAHSNVCKKVNQEGRGGGGGGGGGPRNTERMKRPGSAGRMPNRNMNRQGNRNLLEAGERQHTLHQGQGQMTEEDFIEFYEDQLENMEEDLEEYYMMY